MTLNRTLHTMEPLTDEFAVAKSNGLGSDDLVQAAQAAAARRVATWLFESGRQIAGRLDGAGQSC